MIYISIYLKLTSAWKTLIVAPWLPIEQGISIAPVLPPNHWIFVVGCNLWNGSTMILGVSNTSYVWLVVLTILKNMSQWGWDDIPYMKWKIIPIMFETTNQM